MSYLGYSSRSVRIKDAREPNIMSDQVTPNTGRRIYMQVSCGSENTFDIDIYPSYPVESKILIYQWMFAQLDYLRNPRKRKKKTKQNQRGNNSAYPYIIYATEPIVTVRTCWRVYSERLLILLLFAAVCVKGPWSAHAATRKQCRSIIKRDGSGK